MGRGVDVTAGRPPCSGALAAGASFAGRGHGRGERGADSGDDLLAGGRVLRIHEKLQHEPVVHSDEIRRDRLGIDAWGLAEGLADRLRDLGAGTRSTGSIPIRKTTSLGATTRMAPTITARRAT
jgi:hypothetical protein